MGNAGPGVGVEVGVGVLVGYGMLEAGTAPDTGVFGTCVGVLGGIWVGVLGGGTEVGGNGVGSALAVHAMPIAKTRATHNQTSFVFTLGPPSDVFPRGGFATHPPRVVLYPDSSPRYGLMKSIVSSGYISSISATTPMPPMRKTLPSGSSVAE